MTGGYAVPDILEGIYTNIKSYQLFWLSAYITEEGKTKVNMFFKSSEMIQLTKVRLKVSQQISWLTVNTISAYWCLLNLGIFLLPSSLSQMSLKHHRHTPLLGASWHAHVLSLNTKYRPVTVLVIPVYCVILSHNWSSQMHWHTASFRNKWWGMEAPSMTNSFLITCLF